MCFFHQINDLTPQVIYAARIGFSDPNRSSITRDHLNLLTSQWLKQMEYLRCLVDEAIPSNEFVKACGWLTSFFFRNFSKYKKTYMIIILEEAIIHDTQQTEKAIADLNRSIIVDSTSNIIRRANRILLVMKQEIENSEDSTFTMHLQQVSKTFKESKSS